MTRHSPSGLRKDNKLCVKRKMGRTNCHSWDRRRLRKTRHENMWIYIQTSNHVLSSSTSQPLFTNSISSKFVTFSFTLANALLIYFLKPYPTFSLHIHARSVSHALQNHVKGFETTLHCAVSALVKLSRVPRKRGRVPLFKGLPSTIALPELLSKLLLFCTRAQSYVGFGTSCLLMLPKRYQVDFANSTRACLGTF